MKKLYLFFLSVAACGFVHAQTVAVTFNVDMSALTVSDDGVHIAGDFGDHTDGLPVWDPAATELSDDDADGIYSVTLDLNPGIYQFKFINGNGWDNDEGDGVPMACRYPGSNNREIYVGDAAIERTYVWQGCGPDGEKVVRFRVDMSTQSAVNPVGVHVAGNFQGWDAGGSPLYDADDNGVWEAYYSVGDVESIEFKYINGNIWDNPNENITGDCGSEGGNRLEALTSDNTTLPIYCWSQCEPCTQPAPVTFKVDMSQQTVSADGVHIAGSFAAAGYADWNPGGIEMTDTDDDNIYEVTLNLPNGNYQYKFVNGNAWGGDEAAPTACAAENSTNRFIIINGSDPVVAQYCFGQCSVECETPLDPADITFSVNMSNVAVDAAGPRLIGSFTTPAWQSGQITLQESAVAGIWYATVTVSGSAEIYYKFVNGVADAADESNGEAAGIAECAESNGLGGYNRVHTRSGESETLTTPCFDSCEICGTLISVEETEVVSNLLVYPNPVEDVMNISFSNPTAQKIAIELYNNLGQLVISKDLGTISGQRLTTLNTSALAPGVYSLSISNGMNNRVVRISVK